VIEIEPVNLPETVDAYRRMHRTAPLVLEAQMGRLGDRITNRIQLFAPKVTGALRRAIVFEQRGMNISISDRSSYGIFVRLGTRPHLIVPRFKKALYWPGAAHPVRWVNHPGNQPFDFFEMGLEAAIDEGFFEDAEAVIGSGLDFTFEQ
jgi:hypothetical protein